MPILNLTDAQYQALINPGTPLDKIVSSPLVWALVACGLIILVYYKFFNKNTKADPSTRELWGKEVRDKIMLDQMTKRMNTLASGCSVMLYKGTRRMGLIVALEHDKMMLEKEVIDKKTKAKTYVASDYYNIDRFKFREPGLIGWFLGLFGKGFQYMTITPDAYKNPPLESPKDKQIFVIDPQVHLLNDSNIWTLQDKRAFDANFQLILKVDDEQLHGSAIDSLRRLAVHSSAVSAQLEKLSHESNIKEKERQNRISPYT